MKEIDAGRVGKNPDEAGTIVESGTAPKPDYSP
jgi:hypothetical protein